MSTKNEAAPGDSKPESGESAKSSEKDNGANANSAMTAEYARDEQDRRMVIWGSLLLFLLGAPVFLPTDGARSLWRMTRYDSTGRVILVLIFGGPVFLAIVGLLRGLRRHAPGKPLAILSSIMTCLYTLAAAAMISMILIYERRAIESPLIWLGAFASLAAIISLVRSFFAQRWRRYQHLLAAFGFLSIMIVLAIGGAEPRALVRMQEGGWIFVFAATALFPFSVSTLFGQRQR
jgi:hypothetical protein